MPGTAEVGQVYRSWPQEGAQQCAYSGMEPLASSCEYGVLDLTGDSVMLDAG